VCPKSATARPPAPQEGAPPPCLNLTTKRTRKREFLAEMERGVLYCKVRRVKRDSIPLVQSYCLLY